MRGRKPKPTVLHELHGTLNSTRHAGRANEPEAIGDLASEPPDWMTDAQQDGWRFVMKHAPKGVLKAIDRAVLAVWVEAEDRYRTAARQQALLDRGAKLPLLTKAKDGTAVASPYLSIMNRAAGVLIKCSSELGFTPAARPRLSIPPEQEAAIKPEDKWQRLRVLEGGKGSGAA